MFEQKVKIGGIYEHYKGQQYKAVCVSRHSEDLVWYVVYETLYDNEISRIWHRPVEMFLEEIIVDGKNKPRFRLVE